MYAMRIGALLTVIFGVLGCSSDKQNVRIQEFPSQVEFRYSGADGRLSKTVLTHGEPLADLIEKWCRDNASGWSKSHDTFATSFEYRTADAFLNVRSDFVVANIKKADGRWVQLAWISTLTNSPNAGDGIPWCFFCPAPPLRSWLPL
jgi:hypothetical protein